MNRFTKSNLLISRNDPNAGFGIGPVDNKFEFAVLVIEIDGAGVIRTTATGDDTAKKDAAAKGDCCLVGLAGVDGNGQIILDNHAAMNHRLRQT